MNFPTVQLFSRTAVLFFCICVKMWAVSSLFYVQQEKIFIFMCETMEKCF